jgi:hypothetical protein
MTTHALATQPMPILRAADEARAASPLLWWMGLVFLAFFAATTAAGVFDPRLLNGAGVWDKPAKFFLSLGIHMVTVAWAMSLLPLQTRATRWAAILFVAAAVGETVYIVFRASQGEASHFNTATLIAGILYSLMGLGALTLTATTGFIGWRIWRDAPRTVMAEAAAAGLMLGALLATIGGGYMSSQTGHWVGGDQTDATGLGYFGYSTTGGDLRAAHFIGLHAIQILPFAALSGSRRIVWTAAAAVTLAAAFTFALAVMGIPLLRA